MNQLCAINEFNRKVKAKHELQRQEIKKWKRKKKIVNMFIEQGLSVEVANALAKEYIKNSEEYDNKLREYGLECLIDRRKK